MAAATAIAFDDGSRVIRQNATPSRKAASRKRQRTERALERYYEVTSVASEIKRGGYKRVALQFADHCLHEASRVVAALDIKVNGGRGGNGGDGAAGQGGASTRGSLLDASVELFVLGDTSFGSCCVDEVTAEHYGADLIVHFGHSCLSRPSRVPALLAFGKQRLGRARVDEVAKAVAREIRRQQERQRDGEREWRRVVISGDLGISHRLKAVGSALRALLEGEGGSGDESLWDVLVCEAPRLLLPEGEDDEGEGEGEDEGEGEGEDQGEGEGEGEDSSEDDIEARLQERARAIFEEDPFASRGGGGGGGGLLEGARLRRLASGGGGGGSGGGGEDSELVPATAALFSSAFVVFVHRPEEKGEAEAEAESAGERVGEGKKAQRSFSPRLLRMLLRFAHRCERSAGTSFVVCDCRGGGGAKEEVRAYDAFSSRGEDDDGGATEARGAAAAARAQGEGSSGGEETWKLLRRRYGLMLHAARARVVGVLVGTMSVARSRRAIAR